MALIYSPGPALVYAGLGANGAPLFLGTTEGKPRIEKRPHYVPVHNDYAGGTVPLDEMYVGQDALCHGRFSRFNMAVYNVMVNYGSTNFSGAVSNGNDFAGDRGTLMIQEGAAFPIWLKFARAFKASMNPGGGNNLITGYHFLAAWLVSDEQEPGVAPLAPSLTWHCLAHFSPSANGGVFLLYDYDMTNLPNPD